MPECNRMGLLLDTEDAHSDMQELHQWLTQAGVDEGVHIEYVQTSANSHIACGLEAHWLAQHLPQHNTLDLHQYWQQRYQRPLSLVQETLLALLAAPRRMALGSVQALQSHVRVRCHIAQAAAKTALAFQTQAAQRPQAYWRYDEVHGFLLRPGCDLVEAMEAATQPEATGALYDFSCYRASEYVILLGIGLELRTHYPHLYAQLQRCCQQHAVRSGQFHDVFLTEYGSLQQPVPTHYCVPGDRLWFRNPDAHSSDIEGYEGSWVIYMGQGLFSNFWRRQQPFTLESKCLEIFHWRDGTYTNAQGELAMDESRVAQAVRQTEQDPARRQQVLARMLRLRDPQGIYAQGGCIDASREFPRNVSPHGPTLALPY